MIPVVTQVEITATGEFVLTDKLFAFTDSLQLNKMQIRTTLKANEVNVQQLS
jgi:hypothetical protein